MDYNDKRIVKTRNVIITLCIVIVFLIIGITLLLTHKSDSQNSYLPGVNDITGNNSDTIINNEAALVIDNQNPDFDISEAGILTKYMGTDTIVEIPDVVTSIGADAFGVSPEANNIKKVILGKSVQNVDAQAFLSLTALEDIKVSRNNPYFQSSDGVLIKNDFSIFFCVPNIIRDDYDMFDVFDDIISYKIDGTGIAQLVSGVIIANIKYEYAQSDDILERKYNLYCNSIYANGQELLFDEPVCDTYKYKNDNHYWYKRNKIYDTSAGVVFANTSRYGFGKTWVITNEQIVEIEIIDPLPQDGKIGDVEWYNYSIIRFFCSDNGDLKYYRHPRKYGRIPGTCQYALFSTGFDEFASETGNVRIENGQIIYYPESRYTANSNPNLIEDIKGYYDTFYRDDFPTVDDFLAHNAEIYESAK